MPPPNSFLCGIRKIGDPFGFVLFERTGREDPDISISSFHTLSLPVLPCFFLPILSALASNSFKIFLFIHFSSIDIFKRLLRNFHAYNYGVRLDLPS